MKKKIRTVYQDNVPVDLEYINKEDKVLITEYAKSKNIEVVNSFASADLIVQKMELLLLQEQTVPQEKQRKKKINKNSLQYRKQRAEIKKKKQFTSDFF